MKVEELIAKGVARKYEKGEVLFSVASLDEHYEGVLFHEADVVDGYIRPSDIFGDAVSKTETPAPSEEFPVWVHPSLEEIEVAAEIVEPTAPTENPENIIETPLNTEL